MDIDFTNLTLQGKIITLKSLPRLEDYLRTESILNDPITMQFIQFISPEEGWTKDNLTKRHAERVEQAKNKIGVKFLVLLNDTNELVGEVSFPWLCLKNKQAEIGLILHHTFKGKGIGWEALFLLMQFGFENLNLHRIITKTREINKTMNHLEKAMGMSIAYVEKDSLFHEGQFHDVVIYEHFKHDWPRLQNILQQKIARKIGLESTFSDEY